MLPQDRQAPDASYGKISTVLGCLVAALVIFNLALVFDAFGGRPLSSDGDVYRNVESSVALADERAAAAAASPSSGPAVAGNSAPTVTPFATAAPFDLMEAERVWASLHVDAEWPWQALAELHRQHNAGSVSEAVFERVRARLFAYREPGVPASDDDATFPAQPTEQCRLTLRPFEAGRRLTGVVVTVITGGPGRSQYMLSMVEHSWDALVRFFLVPQGIDFTFVLDASTHSGTEEHVRELATQMHLRLEDAEETLVPAADLRGVPHMQTFEVVTRRWAYRPNTTGWERPFGWDGRSEPLVNVVIRTQPVGFPTSALDQGLVRVKPGVSPPEYEVTHPIDPDYCQPEDAVAYIQGTRWYTYEMFVQPEARAYDYLFKMDYDIFFYDYFPFNVMADMNRRNAMFMHTVRFSNGECTCAVNLDKMNEEFNAAYGVANGVGCSAGEPDFDSKCDRYYTNFVGMRAEYFRSPQVLAYGRWMNEYPKGFFSHRWSDQPAFSKFLGAFIGPNFRDYVVDYSQFRCSKTHECWATLTDEECLARNTTFIHSKGFGQFDRLFGGDFRSPNPPLTPPIAHTDPPFPVSGEWYCRRR